MSESESAQLWYQTNLDVFLNRWYADYEQARQSRERHGGFLLPFQKHFFICQPDVISALGLDPQDSDWEKIGYDCAHPQDPEALDRLRQKREAIVRRSS